MGRDYKLNKSELTRLKSNAKIYSQFLPVLKLKQEQLQIEQIRIKRIIINIKNKYILIKENIFLNTSIFSDISNPYDIEKLIKPIRVDIYTKSVAGINIPILKEIIINKCDIDTFMAPTWLLFIIPELRILVEKHIEINIIQKQYDLITKELKKSTQKVNLFEKILIPETQDAIKRIKIFLGDEEVAAVGRAKTAKNKNIKDLNF